jgi:hypothetical protein
MPGNVCAFGADGFADANLASALGNADQHDVHHANAANEQTNGTKHNGGEGHFAHDVVKFFHLLLGSGDGEIIFAADGHISAALEDLANLIDG